MGAHVGDDGAMGWLNKLLGGAGRSPEQVRAQLRSTVGALPGVGAVELDHRTDASGGGSVRGTVEVADRDAFGASLAAIGRVLGAGGGRIAVYAVGRLPDGTELTPADLGFRPRPSGAELREHYDG